ncbi:hypothetical protein, partial [Actinoplanes philippinensis]|uniref:hypothetical protein n=1 Tax=Actinoplanes philippinensis TaxID=35752 RepID=UPI0033D215CF
RSTTAAGTLDEEATADLPGGSAAGTARQGRPVGPGEPFPAVVQTACTGDEHTAWEALETPAS